MIDSLECVKESFVELVLPAIGELESYIKGTLGLTKFSMVERDRTRLIFQLRFTEQILTSKSQVQVWCLSENPQLQRFEIQCTTLYDITLKEGYP